MPTNRFRPLLLPLLVLIPASACLAAGGYHLWYDENGQAVYSQFAPDGGRESRRLKPPPPPAESPEVARQRLQQRLQTFEDNREDEALARDKAATERTETAQLKRRCEDARRNLTLLNGRPRQLFQTADGIRRLTDQERQAQRAEMEKIIAEDCR